MRFNKPILLVDDDIVDIMTTKKALAENHVTNKIVVCENGEEALDYLKNEDDESPCLIILDLNMPRMSGIEFLEARSEIAKLRRIPVVVMTTSQDEQDKISSYELGAVGYIIKPVKYDAFVKAVSVLNMYWTLNELPVGD